MKLHPRCTCTERVICDWCRSQSPGPPDDVTASHALNASAVAAHSLNDGPRTSTQLRRNAA